MDQHINLAQTLNKPVVLEEFGISRDKNDHDIQGGLMWRNEYFEAVFEMVFQKAGNGPLAGCNFWAWGGLGRPSAPKAIWQKGDDFIGDPPHEYQGWYSVYDVDEETLDIIKTYSLKIKQIK